MTFAAFLLARGRMTDRFALHAVVVGFGAHEPVRPGEPYRCRACEAALPPIQGTPIVRCVYCHQESVLGLDLRADAREAEREHRSLDDALAARTRERWLWTLGSVAAIGLLALAWFAVKPSLRKAPPNAADAAFAPPKKYESGAPKFRNIGRHAKLVSMTGTLPFDASSCDLYVAPSGLNASPCRVRFVCNGRDVFGGDAPRDCFVYDKQISSLRETLNLHDETIRFEFDDHGAMMSSEKPNAPQTTYEARFSFDPKARAIAQTSASPPPTATASTKPFDPIDRTATVITQTGALPFSAKTCKLHVSQLHDDACRALLTCGGKRVYGSTTSTTACPTKDGALLLLDLKPTPQDNDPVFIGNLQTGSLDLSDVAGDGGVYRVTFTLGY